MPKRIDLRSILFLRSGPTVIARPTKFDYCGTRHAARGSRAKKRTA